MVKKKPFFIIGTKRSGTSFFTRLINHHPKIFLAREADLIWLLYQKTKGIKEPRKYYYDTEYGMKWTFHVCRSLIESSPLETKDEIQDTYYKIMHQLMTSGSQVQTTTYTKPRVEWVGDKKPVQHSDPKIQQFLNINFPEAKFIHLIRHPRNTIDSMQKVPRPPHLKPPHWNLEPEDRLKYWMKFQNWVLDIKQIKSVLTIRFEDLIINPVIELNKVFQFLGLERNETVDQALQKQYEGELSQKNNVDAKHEIFQLPRVPGVNELLDLYGYK